jgi:hypothetical protein
MQILMTRLTGRTKEGSDTMDGTRMRDADTDDKAHRKDQGRE